MSDLFGKMAEALIAGNIAGAQDLTKQAIDAGEEPQTILSDGLLPGMDVVGKRFKANDMFIPEVILSAKTMHAAMEILRPLLSEGDAKSAGTVIIGTVEGDLHDIGKNLVAMMLEGGGFDVVDLGTNVTPQQFVDGVKAHKPQLIGMSALLTTTMPKMELTIKALQEAGLRDQVKVMAGGAPVTQQFVDKIGGDAYGANAAAVVDIAKELTA
ncbi:MAG: corrinoid protein [Desulfobacterales bacterium]|nr:corrinoid protein [Desulfobacterales bacterium]